MTRHPLLFLTALLSAIQLSLASGQCPALAHRPVQPSLFALSSSSFPLRSQVVRAGVESNRQLGQDDPVHFGFAPSVLGRLTGYTMEAVDEDPTSPSSLSYLVSIFRTAQQAHEAFSLRWSSWFSQDYYTSPAPPPVRVGEKGDHALFHTYPGQEQLTELFFRRGAVLVEVFANTGQSPPSSNQLQAISTIATKLDALARHHPRGA